MKRRILAMLLVAVMVASFAFAASAADIKDNTDYYTLDLYGNPTNHAEESNEIVWGEQRWLYSSGWTTTFAGSDYLKAVDIGNVVNLVKGWYEDPNGKFHYFDQNGDAVTSKWVGDYYLMASGVMATSTWVGNYYVGADGKWIPNPKASGWELVKRGKRGWKFVKADGNYATGWNDIEWIDADTTGLFNGYYFDYTTGKYVEDNSRKMVEGKKYTYYFNSQGYLITDQWVGDYYVGKDGVMLRSTWIKNANGTYSYVDQNGKYVPGYQGEGIEGNYLERGLAQSLEGRYFVLINGVPQYVSNQWIGDNYFNKDGYLVRDQWVGDYFVDADGNLVKATSSDAFCTGHNVVSNANWGHVKQIGNFFVNESGKALTNTWIYKKATDEWYYVGSNYKLTKDAWVGDYYVGGTGAMLKNAWVGEYFVGNDGKWVK